jgi:uncharacterized SAM-binding protein YcdF (DUF218 family)
MSIVVLVPGYGGRFRGVERWRMQVAERTLRVHGGGRLIVSGHRGEAQRLAAMTASQDVIIEPTARSTWENIERSIPFLEAAPRIAVATDRFHERVAASYLRQLRPDLARRLVRPSRQWWRGSWIQVGGAGYVVMRTAARRAAHARSFSGSQPSETQPKRSPLT